MKAINKKTKQEYEISPEEAQAYKADKFLSARYKIVGDPPTVATREPKEAKKAKVEEEKTDGGLTQ